MPLENFERELIKKYKSNVIDAIGKIKNLSLSTLLSKMIGPADFKEDGSFSGFFQADRHDSNNLCNYCKERRHAAINALSNILKMDNKNKGISFDSYYLNPRHVESNDLRRKYQFNNFIIHNGMEGESGNVLDLFPRELESSCGITKKNGKACTIKACFNYNLSHFNKEFVLYLPKEVLKNRVTNILWEIHRHTLCSHNNTSESSIIIRNIEFNSGTDNHESLYFMILEIHPVTPWKPNPNKDNDLRLPDQTINDFESQNLFMYCDYLIIAPQDTTYKILPVNGSINHRYWQSLSDCVELTLRYNNKIKFEFNSNENITITTRETACINVSATPKPIFHIFVFDNYKKAAGGASQGGQCG